MTDPEESVLNAAKKLVDGEIDSLPVVRSVGPETDKTFEVVGRVTKTNITRLLVEMGQGKRR
jgi:CBS domain-containing protein